MAQAADAGVQVRCVGGFHVGGRVERVVGLPRGVPRVFSPGGPARVPDPNGAFLLGQMYAHYTLLAAPRGRYPLVMWHGGGMTGATWEDTPDGRSGWQWRFLQAGHDVYVCDAVERGRAGWTLVPEAYGGDPVARSLEEAWTTFRFGPPDGYHPEPQRRKPFSGQRFPIHSLEQFGRQCVPRWTTTTALTQEAYDAMVAAVGPCVLMMHSQGGNFGFTAALHAPDRVRAVIAIEPSGRPPATPEALAAVAHIPHLVVWGDFIDRSPHWQATKAAVGDYLSSLENAGAAVEVIDLPARGIAGNSHFPMMDDNSDTVAALVQDWIGRKGLMR